MGRAGRPKEENPRDQKITIRLTKEEREELMAYTDKHDQTITQVVSDALSLLYEKDGNQ
ncbi:MAG: hypothetical protein Q4D51_11810 [Eubacteriales bacterium]|nr:hypothetical protein [Eubacteriales bacterium]